MRRHSSNGSSAKRLPDLMTVQEVCVKLRISRSKVYELIATGELTSYRIGGCRRVGEDDVYKFLEKSRDRVEHCSKRLLNASPSRILKRGFVLVRDEEGKLVSRRSGIERGQSLTNQFSDGEIKVEVTEN